MSKFDFESKTRGEMPWDPLPEPMREVVEARAEAVTGRGDKGRAS